MERERGGGSEREKRIGRGKERRICAKNVESRGRAREGEGSGEIH